MRWPNRIGLAWAMAVICLGLLFIDRGAVDFSSYEIWRMWGQIAVKIVAPVWAAAWLVALMTGTARRRR